jgi:hypothetical protein
LARRNGVRLFGKTKKVMADFVNTTGKTASSIPGKRQFKYPSEEEYLVRRLGAAALAVWGTLPPETQAQIMAQAINVWDRERDVPKLAAKLETFVKRFPGRMV